MRNKECDIMKDLLPSYVDEICTEASKEWVEQHLKGCEDCKKTVELLKNTELSAKQLEQEKLEATRKVIRQNLRRSTLNLSLSLCLVMAILMIMVFEADSVQVPRFALHIVLPVCMMMTWLVCRNQAKRRDWDKWDVLMTIGAVLAAGYGTVMMLYGFDRVNKEGTLFDLPLNEIGPFLYAQMVLSAVMCFIVYLVQVVRVIKQGRSNSVVLNLCLLGIFLMMAYCVFMRQLMDLDTAVQQLKVATVSVIAVGLVGTAVFGMVDVCIKR